MSRLIYSLSVALFCLLGVLAPHLATAQIYWIEVPEFAPPSTGYNPELADLDADGDQDLIYAVVLQSYRNTGTPSSPSWEQDNSLVADVTYQNSMTTCLADLDADGDLDLSVGYLYGEVWPLLYYRNVGTPAEPVWQDAFHVYDGLEPNAWTCPELADLDGDGDFDLLLAVEWGLRAYRNTGTPEEPSWSRDGTLIGGISLPHGYVEPSLGDLDGDGDLDLVLGGRWGHGPIVCYENTGTPQAPAWLENETMLEGVDRDVEGLGLDLADLDGDGDPDLLVWSGEAGPLVYLNCGPATAIGSDGASSWSSIKALYGRPRSN